MSSLNSEPIYQAIYNRLNAAPVLPLLKQAPSRRTRFVSEVAPAEQPALFIESGEEVPVYLDENTPAVWTLRPHLLLYARTDDASQAPSSIINPIVAAIRTALVDLVPGWNTPSSLGGLVAHLHFGPIVIGEGLGGDSGQGYAVIPLEILVPETA